jgi:hypothetical protein
MSDSPSSSLSIEAWSGSNPFNVTKANDLTDAEIQSMWVDLAADGGYRSVIDPQLPMPRMLLGGKGTGRTHLMRFLSAPVQRVRNPTCSYAGPIEEGYLGIYLRCTGLNAGRFQGKGIEEDTWQAVFTYSMDLSLARVAVDTIITTFRGHSEFDAAEPAIAAAVAELFDEYGHDMPGDFDAVKADLRDLQGELDLAVNNAAITRDLSGVTIRVSRGHLVFGIPQVVQSLVPALKEIRWLYLIDELENLTMEQQKYVQTLIREREEPTSFIVGARTYGVRTKETLSAGEENKVGSEFDPVELDHIYRDNPAKFSEFCRKIVEKRLVDAGHTRVDRERLDEYFFELERRGVAHDEEVTFVAEQKEPVRRYLVRLREQLVQFHHLSDAQAISLVELLEVPEHALIERLNVLLLYRAWKAKDVQVEAERIGAEATAFLNGDPADKYSQSYGHWAGDVLARLLKEYGEKQRYLGLPLFIDMAGGLPRNLLIILKNVVRAAEFNGETPFRDEPISADSQRAGVIRAAEWFYRDGRAMGEAGVRAERAVNRIGDLLRALRFADKPPEVSVSTISLRRDALNALGKEALETASGWSLLLEQEEGQRDKSNAAIIEKFQLNPMLCPRWDLPVYRRGVLSLSAAEAASIFNEPDNEPFDRLRKARVARATVPFRAGKAESQATLLPDDA